MKGNWKKYLGPGPLVAAAFIGPGTVTVCTLAGVNFGYDLLWALALSVFTTIVLQEMAARIGLITQRGLASNLSVTIQKSVWRFFSLTLVLLAIVLGNAAYEAGNISGGALGAEIFLDLTKIELGKLQINPLNVLIGVFALVLLFSGSYTLIIRFLTGLVILMSLAFVVSAILVQPPLSALLQGFVPRIQGDQIITIVALIGTTVVPYNLFLHSGLVAKRWQNLEDLKYVRTDTMIAVVLGGLVSMAIVVTGVAGASIEVNSAVDLAKGLEPLLGGKLAKYFIAFGLFAAGITSAVTAPLAASMVITESFGCSSDIKGMGMKGSIGIVLGLGLVFSSLGIRPVQLITLAQLANGILLPLLSGYVIWLVNRKSLMKGFENSLGMNLLSMIIWLITLLLGFLSILKVFGII
ncbi:Nramp family divalent metal transporter [Cecembia calidifontis]|uniref:NRAMP (Natural resistance-associated macrophage protein)-like metal ion transporter n=1 Tax=Cecembia calidifontis TaxID=1187080 RepID=A0A4Q7PF65_9BACT|nr:Nramp family divalent metal transporter [Cecembia calidifontis]RZS97492.1 NRAMP (natural resistance-associated macrophage protein)-like metal ion transporter [Cecembia calidifontis]